MRVVIAVLAVAALSLGAAANPLPAWPAVSLTFADDGTFEPEIYPAPGTTHSAYMMVTCGLEELSTSLSAISFAIGYTPGVIVPTSYTSLLADVVITGDWETGITLAATEPVLTSQVFVARIDFLYTGGAGYLTVEDHPFYPRYFLAGDGYEYPYCLVNDAGVGQPFLLVEDYCWFCEPMQGNPVDEINWGTIKALYR